jgi:tetratricopeptide (TPR) repeat protein
MALERALEMAETLAEAERRLARGDAKGAYGLAEAVRRRDPESAEAARILGLIAIEHGNVLAAEALFRQAAARAPADSRHHAQLSRCLIALNRQSEARAAAERSAALAPQDAHTLDTLGVAFSRLGSHARALPFLRAAAERAPANASIRYNLASAEQFAGQLEEAAADYRAAVKLAPDMYKAWSALSALHRHTPDDNLIAELERCRAADPADVDRALHMGHALAKAYEDLGDCGAAMEALAAGKAGKRAALAYDVAADAALFAAAAASWSQTAGKAGSASSEPIFVVGLPRTGTTLVDRILSSHPDVCSAGELTNFGLLLKRSVRSPGPHVLEPAVFEGASAIDLARLGQAYVDSTRPLTGGTPRFVDKMPLNVLYAGLIARALPRARIICLRRHPLDSILSNYRQLFATSFTYYNYSFDLASTAEYYIQFDRLVGLWRRFIPAEQFRELSYEGLVADQDAETRRLLEFVGLPWDDRCLRFHENEAPVATASSAQVRRPLHASSVGRWRRFEPWLGPAKAVLQREGLQIS